MVASCLWVGACAPDESAPGLAELWPRLLHVLPTDLLLEPFDPATRPSSLAKTEDMESASAFDRLQWAEQLAGDESPLALAFSTLILSEEEADLFPMLGRLRLEAASIEGPAQEAYEIAIAQLELRRFSLSGDVRQLGAAYEALAAAHERDPSPRNAQNAALVMEALGLPCQANALRGREGEGCSEEERIPLTGPDSDPMWFVPRLMAGESLQAVLAAAKKDEAETGDRFASTLLEQAMSFSPADQRLFLEALEATFEARERSRQLEPEAAVNVAHRAAGAFARLESPGSLLADLTRSLALFQTAHAQGPRLYRKLHEDLQRTGFYRLSAEEHRLHGYALHAATKWRLTFNEYNEWANLIERLGLKDHLCDLSAVESDLFEQVGNSLALWKAISERGTQCLKLNIGATRRFFLVQSQASAFASIGQDQTAALLTMESLRVSRLMNEPVAIAGALERSARQRTPSQSRIALEELQLARSFLAAQPNEAARRDLTRRINLAHAHSEIATRPDQAAQRFRTTLRQQSATQSTYEHLDARVGLARALLKMERSDEAREALLEALAELTENLSGLTGRVRQGVTTSAREVFDLLIRLDWETSPARALLWCELEAQLVSGRIEEDEAKSWIRTAEDSPQALITALKLSNRDAVVIRDLPNRLLFWRLTKERLTTQIWSVDSTTLSSLVSALISSLEKGREFQATRDRMVAAMPGLADTSAEHVVVFASPSLPMMPFSFLINGSNTERSLVTTVPNLASVVRSSAGEKPRSALLVGNPTATPRFATLPALPGATREIEHLANEFQDAERLERQAANRGQLEVQASHHQVLHIATHTADGVSGAGLVLAGESPEDEGLLEADQIADMQFDNLHLVFPRFLPVHNRRNG